MNWLVFPALVLSLLLFPVGEKSICLCSTRSMKAGLLVLWFVLGIPGFLFPLYYTHWFDRVEWYYAFRAVPFVELTAAGAGLFAGALAALCTPYRFVCLAILCGGIVIPHIKPVLGRMPPDGFANQWSGGVCLQSTPSSCGLASAASVFSVLGEFVTERELAEECFTYTGGTENWYLARAFSRRGLDVTVRITSGVPDDLQLPAIAGVRIGTVGHFIAILGETDQVVFLGDPLVGRSETSKNSVSDAYEFTGFFMEVQRPER